MKVRVIRNNCGNEVYKDLTQGNIYHVITVEGKYYRVLSDEGLPYLYPQDMFSVVNDDTTGWIRTEEEGVVNAGPKDFLEEGFFEDYFDDKEYAIGKLRAHMARLCGRFIDLKD